MGLNGVYITRACFPDGFKAQFKVMVANNSTNSQAYSKKFFVEVGAETRKSQAIFRLFKSHSKLCRFRVDYFVKKMHIVRTSQVSGLSTCIYFVSQKKSQQ